MEKEEFMSLRMLLMWVELGEIEFIEYEFNFMLWGVYMIKSSQKINHKFPYNSIFPSHSHAVIALYVYKNSQMTKRNLNT